MTLNMTSKTYFDPLTSTTKTTESTGVYTYVGTTDSMNITYSTSASKKSEGILD